MPAPCVASLPCAKPTRRQRGAALILAILTVALVAGLAAAIMHDYGAAVASISGRHDQAQARLLARGAVDWARNVLAEDKRTSGYDYPGEAWATHVPPTPVEEGEVSGEIQDMSGHFDLNRLLNGSTADPEQVAAYVRLLGLLGVADAQAQDLAAALLAWLGAGAATASNAESVWYALQTPPRQPAHAPLVDIDELSLVRGYDANLVALLRPFVAALPQPSLLNVNTASAEVLAAMLPKLGLDSARMMTAQQQGAPFKDLADFRARLANNAVSVSDARFGTSSRYFLASGRAHFGEATTRMEVLLDRQNTWPEIVWQKIL